MQQDALNVSDVYSKNTSNVPYDVRGKAIVVRRTLPKIAGAILLFLFGVFAFAHAAEPELRLSPRKIRDEVHATVEAQLNALREGDFERAYDLASSGIKMQFDVRLFAALIRHGYPVLLQANEADIGVVRDKNEELAQVTVSVLDRQKRNIVYSYWLVREEGGWRINGVVLDQKPPRGDI